jgi:5-methylthioadenosine/S-adenosylhomocysteine deaminase
VPDALVYEACARDVTDVWIAGRAQLKERELSLLDAARISDAARQWSARMGTGGQR